MGEVVDTQEDAGDQEQQDADRYRQEDVDPGRTAIHSSALMRTMALSRPSPEHGEANDGHHVGNLKLDVVSHERAFLHLGTGADREQHWFAIRRLGTLLAST